MADPGSDKDHMSLPKALAREAQEAAALQQSLLPQAPQPNVVVDAAQLTQPAPQPPAPAVEPAPTPAAPAPAPDEASTLRQQLRTLQGKYNAEVAPLSRELAESRRQMEVMSRQMAEMRTKLEKPAPQTEQPQVDKRDAETFGADLMDMVMRYLTQHGQALRSEFMNKSAELDERVGSLEAHVQGVSRRTSESLEGQFYALLDKLVPDWRDVNEDDDWKAWLDQKDPIYGARRQDALDHAHRHLDAQRVANVFNAYKATKPTPRQPDSLESQVAPTSVASAPPPPQAPAVQYISEKFIQTFYNEVARTGGKFQGSVEKAQQIDAEINKAAAEGRIVK